MKEQPRNKHSSDNERGNFSFERAQMLKLHREAKRMRELDASKAVELSEKALDIATRIEDKEYRYECSYLLGRCLTIQGELDRALEVLSDALHVARQHFFYDKKKLCVATNAIGIVYYSKDSLELALDYFLKALQFNVSTEKLKIYNNLGNTYTSSQDYQKALDCFNKALVVARRENDIYMVAALLLNTATSLVYLDDLELAERNSQEALSITEKRMKKDPRFSYLNMHVLLSFGEIYIRKKEFERALELINQSLEMAKQKSSHVSYCMGLNFKTTAYLNMGDEQTAIQLVNETLPYAEKYHLDREKKYLLANVIEFYENKGDYQKAYPFLKKLQEHTQEEANFSRDKNFKRIIAHREREIELLEDKNKEIGEQNFLLEQFAHIISHDLKEPIRNIVSFSSLLAKRYQKNLDDDGQEFLKYIVKGATKMNENLVRLLEFTTLDKLAYDEIQTIECSKIFKELELSYKNAIEPFEVNIRYPDAQFSMVYGHAYALLDELVSNAVKFRRKGMNCYIEVNIEEKDSNHHFTIKDYGIGIESEYRRKIFRIFNRLNKQEYDGSGVGLAICDRIIKLYGGNIWIESQLGVHTTVHFILPKDFYPKNKKITRY